MADGKKFLPVQLLLVQYSYKKQFPHVEIKNAPWRPGDVMHTQADISRTEEALGYKPLVRFWDGLKKTITWWNL